MKSADDERSAAADAVEENAAPLLQPAGGAHDGAALNPTSSGVMQEAKLVWRLALPICGSQLASFMGYLITTAQVGQLGAADMSAFTLARTFYHITGLSLVMGLGSGLDTFCGQAFGARQFRQLGVMVQRAALINLIVTAAVLVGWFTCVEQLMLALGQDPALVGPAAKLLRLMSPSLIPYAVAGPLHAYFSTQGVVLPLALLAACSAVLTPLLNYPLLSRFGVAGAPLASNILMCCELIGYVALAVWLHMRQPPGEQTWGGLDIRTALRGWPAFLKIAIPGMGAICLDWWCFEAMVLIAGLQPDARVQLGAMGVLFASHSLAFMASSGFGAAVAIRTANELGAGRPAEARRATIVASVSGGVPNAVFATAFLLFSKQWARLYSSDPEMVAVIASAMAFLALSVMADSLNAVLSGVLRGAGHQTIGFMVNLVTFWALGLPLAYYLDIERGLGAQGVWMALSGVGLVQALVLAATVASFSWKALAARAQRLVAEGHGVSVVEAEAAAAGPGGHHGVYEPLLGAPHV